MAENVELVQKIDPVMKKEVTDISEGKSEYQTFINKLRKVEQDYLIGKELPYDYRAAKQEYEALVKEKYNSNPKKYDYNENNVKIENFDFEKYGKKERFELIKKTAVVENVLIEGMKHQKITGHYADYKSKEFKNNVSVFEKAKDKK